MGIDMSELQKFSGLVKQAVSKGDIDVPMLPEVAYRVLSLTRDSDSTAGQMAELIQADQALAGHVMRIANSAAYSAVSDIVSLRQAVARLGMKVISEIAISAVFSAKMFKTPDFEDYVEFNWQHAIATSLWSKEIAQLCDIDTEVAFMGGLLHSIGRPALLQTILDLGERQKQRLTPETVHSLENRYSQQVTELVLTKWNLPEQVVKAAKPYEQVDEADDAFKIAAAVHVGARLATYMLDVGAEDDRSSLMDMPALEVLSVDEDQLIQLMNEEEKIQQRLDSLSL